MQIILYTNGKQVVSNDADVSITAENVKNSLGEGSRSVPMGAAMFMIYAEGDNGVEVSAIVSELTFSSVPSTPVKAAETAEPAKEQPVPVPATARKAAETQKPAAPAVAKPVPKPVAKPVQAPKPIAKPVSAPVKPVAKPAPQVQKPASAPQKTVQSARSVPEPAPVQPAQSKTVSRPAIRQRNYHL